MSVKMSVYYDKPEDAESFESSYTGNHLPLLSAYKNMTRSSFHKATRVLGGDFPYGYVWTGTWEDRDGWKEDMNSEASKAVNEDAGRYGVSFHVVVWEQLS